ncbi:MAG TPA: nicotinate-nucleotide adenylyltransferase [Candidatus Limnocylindrales bacterium]|nr:nicotinate-nucleotide adenylyltransferase [Candidatus Limnocylindrales bacterium]
MSPSTGSGGAGGAIGILGGTFDPVHWGHLAIAEEAREALGLARVLFVPAARPPHKAGLSVTRAEHRVAMLEAAVADNPAFAVSRLELDRAGPSYTVDTLEALAADRATSAASRWFILSTEALAGFPSWHRPERILELACLAVVPRAGRPELAPSWIEEALPGSGPRIRWLDGPAIDVSASQIRARAATGRSIRYLVPGAVAAYIAHHDLYRAGPSDRRPQPRRP